MTGVTLAIIGGTKLTPGNSPSNQALGHTLSKTASILFLIVYLALCGMNLLLWGAKEDIPPNHRKVNTTLFGANPRAANILYITVPQKHVMFPTFPCTPSPLLYPWRICRESLEMVPSHGGVAVILCVWPHHGVHRCEHLCNHWCFRSIAQGRETQCRSFLYLYRGRRAIRAGKSEVGHTGILSRAGSLLIYLI